MGENLEDFFPLSLREKKKKKDKIFTFLKNIHDHVGFICFFFQFEILMFQARQVFLHRCLQRTLTDVS